MTELQGLDADALTATLEHVKATRKSLGRRENFVCVILKHGQCVFGRGFLTLGSTRLLLLWPRIEGFAIVVPVSSAASVFVIDAQRGQINDSLFDHSVEVARACGLRRLRFIDLSALLLSCLCCMRDERYEPLHFSSYTPLYCDFSFFSNLSGGITGVGLATPFGGGSAQWQKSLFGLMYKKVHQTPTNLGTALARSPVYEELVCRGHLEAINEGQTTFIEGRQWMSGLLVESRSASDSGRAAIASYVCKDSFLFPVEAFREIRSPCVFYGELYPIQIKTPYASYDRALKVRAIAYV